MSLLERTALFYRRPFNTPAAHYRVHPEGLQAWLAAGNLGASVERGRYFRQPEAVQVGRGQQVKHTPYYRMPTADFMALEIARDHTLEFVDPDTGDLAAFRVANFEHTDGGHTRIRLQGASPE